MSLFFSAFRNVLSGGVCLFNTYLTPGSLMDKGYLFLLSHTGRITFESFVTVTTTDCMVSHFEDTHVRILCLLSISRVLFSF